MDFHELSTRVISVAAVETKVPRRDTNPHLHEPNLLHFIFKIVRGRNESNQTIFVLRYDFLEFLADMAKANRNWTHARAGTRSRGQAREAEAEREDQRKA